MRTVTKPRRRCRQRGVALVIALWLSVLVVMVAAMVSRDARTAARLGGAQLGIAQAEALLDGAEALARDELQRAQHDRLGQWRQMGAASGDMAWRVVPATARVDLNAASPEMLEGLLEVVAPGRGSLAASIVDSRRPTTRSGARSGTPINSMSDATTGTGAFPRLTRSVARESGPFRSVEDLMGVPGLADSVVTLLAPHVTVYSGDRRIDPLAASWQVLQAIPGLSPERVVEFERSRRETPRSPRLAALASGSTWLMRRTGSQIGEIHIIEVRGRSRRGVSLARDVVTRPAVGRVDVVYVGRIRHERLPPALALEAAHEGIP